MEISPEDLINEIEQEVQDVSPEELAQEVAEISPEDLVKEADTSSPVSKQDTAKFISEGIAKGWKGLKASERYVSYDELKKIEDEIKKAEKEFGGEANIGLKIPFVNPKINPMDIIVQPANKAIEAFTKQSGVVKGLESGARAAGGEFLKSLTGKGEMSPVLSDELAERGVFRPDPDNPEKFIVDTEKLAKTSYPVAKILDEEADRIIKNNGFQGNEKAKKELMTLASLRGSASGSNLAGTVLEVLDAATFNIASRSVIDSALKDSVLLKRPESVNILKDNEIDSIRSAIDKANADNAPVKWKSDRFDEIEIQPKDTVTKIEDYLFAKNMSLNITAFVQKNQVGLAQFVGNISTEILLGASKAIPWVAKAASKIPGIESTAAKIAVPVTRTVAESAAMGYGAVVGENVEEERLQAMLDNFTMAAGLNVTGYGMRKGVSGLISAGNKMKMLREVKEGKNAEAFVDAVRQAKTFEEYNKNPNNVGFKVNETDFNAAKDIVLFSDKNMLDRLALSRGIKEENHYDPATQQGAKEFVRRSVSPEATPLELELRKNLETYYALTHDMRTMQEGRVEAALVATFRNRNELDLQEGRAKYKEDTARGKILTEEGFIAPYRNLLSDPEAVIKLLEERRPDLVDAFKGHVNAPFFSPEEFATRSFMEALDSTHQVTPENVGEMSRSLEARSEIYRELSEKYDPADTGKIKEEITARIETLKKNIVEGKSRVDSHKTSALIFLDKLHTAAVEEANPASSFIAGVMSYIKKDMPITDNIKADLNVIVKELEIPSNAVGNSIDSYNKSLDILDESIVKLGEYQELHTNLDPSAVPNRKMQYITEDADRMVYALLRNESPVNLNYIRDSFFNGEKWDADFQPIMKSITYEKLPQRQSVAAEINAIIDIINNNKYSSKQVEALTKLLPVLESYEKDIGLYKEAYKITEVRDLNIITRLSALRNNMDAIKNPILAKEIHDLIQNRHDEFLKQMKYLKIPLSSTEKTAVWEWATGSNGIRIKQQLTNYSVLNEEVLNSMFKATNTLGREMIDLYGEVYAATFGATLDKNAFHAYFLTTANDFDKKSGLLAALFAEFQKVQKLKKSIISSKVQKALITTYGNMDYVERAIESVTQMSLGTYLSDLNNSVRGAKLSVDNFLQNTLAPILMKSDAYLNINHPTLDAMSKKAKGLAGFDGYLFIDKRKQDGSHEMTAFGRFLHSIFNDEVFLKELNDELSRVEYSSITGGKVLKGAGKDIHELLSEKAIDEGFVSAEHQRSKDGMLEADAWATQILTYWGDIFPMKDAPQMWNALVDWRAKETKIMAQAFKECNDKIAEINAREAQRNGSQFPLLKWREQRLENRLSHTQSSFNPYEIEYQDIRMERSYGTSKWAQTIRAKELHYTNTQNAMESFITDMVTSFVGANTQHARSYLLPLIHNMERLGYKAPAEYLINKAALGEKTSLMLENFNMEQYLNAARGTLFSPLLAGWRSVSPWVMPFLSLNSFKSITRGAVEAVNTSTMYGPKSAWKTPIRMAFALSIALAQRIPMVLFYDRSGNPRYSSMPLVYGEPRYAEAVSRVKSKYKDAVHNEFVLNLQAALKEGKTFGADEFKDIGRNIGGTREKASLFAWTVANKSAKNSAIFSKFIFENLKERFEMYTSRINLNKGARFAQSIETLMKNGDFDGAYAATQNALQFYTQPKIFQIYKEMETAFKNGKFENSLDSFLTAFHDGSTGRFGPTTVPEIVKTVGKFIPNFGLFHSAINLDIFRMLGTGAYAFSGLPESKAARVLFIKMLASQYAVHTALNWADGGASEEALVDLLPKDQIGLKLTKPMKEWETKTFFSKLLAEGYSPFLRTGDWAPTPAKMFLDKDAKTSFTNVGLSMLGFTSAISGRGIKVPIVGMNLTAVGDIGASLYEYVAARQDAPDYLSNDLDASEKYNSFLSKAGSKHYEDFVEAIKNAKTANEIENAKIKFEHWQNFAGPTLMEKFWHIGPTSIITQNVINPFYMTHLFDTLKQAGAASIPFVAKNMTTVSESSNEQADKLKHELFEQPVSNVLNFSALNQKDVVKSLLRISAETPEEIKNRDAADASIAPQFVKDIYAELYNTLGLYQWDGTPESFAKIMDRLVIFASETGVIKNPEFTKHMAEQGKKNYNLMLKDKTPEVDMLPETTIQRKIYDKMQKGN